MAKRLLSLVLSLFLVLSLAACGGGGGKGSSSMASGGAVVGGGQSAPESAPAGRSDAPEEPEPSSPAVPDRDPIGGAAAVDYPELAPAELTASPVYQEALGRPSVILYNDQPLTDPRPVRDFLTAVADKKDWDLFVYSFTLYDGFAGVFLTHFLSDGGEVVKREAYESGWESLAETEHTYRVHPSMALNDYGYLTYRDAYGEYAFPVINGRALYEDGEERQRLYDTYLAPVFYVACGSDWASPQQLGRLTWVFDSLYSRETGRSPREDFGDSWPVEVMVETLSRYFDGITADDVIGRLPYDPQSGTVRCEGIQGGGPLCLRVTGYTREGDRLAIDYQQYDPSTGIPFEGTGCLTVRLLEDGSFRYLSNRAA